LSDSSSIAKAVEVLRAGHVLALPTETVYGLGADASNPQAIQKIYALKGRPSDHPLIVHVRAPLERTNHTSDAWLSILAPWTRHIPDHALTLIHHFWPGPLTLIFEKSKSVLENITGGQGTIALRSPAHPLTQELLRTFGGGIAAPSANRYGRISPTSAADVRAEFPNENNLLILDGGPCEHGIESTILDVSNAGAPKLLRPGAITPSQIKAMTGIDVDSATQELSLLPRVSGSHQAHYAPYTPLHLYQESDIKTQLEKLKERDRDKNSAFVVWTNRFAHYKKILGDYSPMPEFIIVDQDPILFAKGLYRLLRDLDTKNYDSIFIPHLPFGENWDAVRDRLQRASFGSGPSSKSQVSN